MDSQFDDSLIDYLPLQLELLICEAIELFNQEPSKAKKFLTQKKLMLDTPAAMANFIISQSKLSKRRLGEYLGSVDYYNQCVCEAYVRNLSLEGSFSYYPAYDVYLLCLCVH